tara:strand:- start:253 stop:438 length:186 start_codon:yes stop_codon:yes gene_type:complete
MKHTFKVKGVDIGSLNKNQRSAIRRHSAHHTKKHIQEMVSSMNRGSSFNQSHIQAMRKVGK